MAHIWSNWTNERLDNDAADTPQSGLPAEGKHAELRFHDQRNRRAGFRQVRRHNAVIVLARASLTKIVRAPLSYRGHRVDRLKGGSRDLGCPRICESPMHSAISWHRQSSLGCYTHWMDGRDSLWSCGTRGKAESATWVAQRGPGALLRFFGCRTFKPHDIRANQRYVSWTCNG